MNLTCINKGKFANLTANRNYEGAEDGEFYVVVNDMGARARYAKKYFRVAPDAEPVPAPAPARPAPQNLMDVVEIESDNLGDEIEVRINFGGRVEATDIGLNVRPSEISCGITEIYGINGIGEQIASRVNTLPDRIINRDIDALCDALVREIIEASESNGMILLSDVINDNDPLQAALTRAAVTTASCENRGTNNNIMLWVLLA